MSIASARLQQEELNFNSSQKIRSLLHIKSVRSFRPVLTSLSSLIIKFSNSLRNPVIIKSLLQVISTPSKFGISFGVLRTFRQNLQIPVSLHYLVNHRHQPRLNLICQPRYHPRPHLSPALRLLFCQAHIVQVLSHRAYLSLYPPLLSYLLALLQLKALRRIRLQVLLLLFKL